MSAAGPPTDGSVAGGRVLAQPVLVRAPGVMAVVRDLVVYPTGLEVVVETAVAAEAVPSPPRLTAVLPGGAPVDVPRLDGDADGAGARMDRYWLPLPPPDGDLVLRAEWPAGGPPPGEALVTARQMDAARARIIA